MRKIIDKLSQTKRKTTIKCSHRWLSSVSKNNSEPTICRHYSKINSTETNYDHFLKCTGSKIPKIKRLLEFNNNPNQYQDTRSTNNKTPNKFHEKIYKGNISIKKNSIDMNKIDDLNKENDQLTTNVDMIKEQDLTRKDINGNVIAKKSFKKNDHSNQPIGNNQDKDNATETVKQIIECNDAKYQQRIAPRYVNTIYLQNNARNNNLIALTNKIIAQRNKYMLIGKFY